MKSSVNKQSFIASINDIHFMLNSASKKPTIQLYLERNARARIDREKTALLVY